jgi:hypothetical protein
VRLNGTDLGYVEFDSQMKGVAQFSVPNSLLTEGANQLLLIAQGGEGDVSLVDYVRLTYLHTFTADDNALRVAASANQLVSISGFTSSEVRVMDVTNADSVRELAATVQAGKAGFTATATVADGGPATLFAFGEDQVKSPAAIQFNQPSAWRQTAQGADLVIITHKDFSSSLAALKVRRQSQGLAVAEIDIEDIYDEFNSGHKSVQALRDFLAFVKNSWKRAPRFALFAGDASFDPRNYLGAGNLDFVPTRMIETALLETASDDALADSNQDGLADLALGRLPVRTAQEASGMVSKIISYEQAPLSDTLLLVADRNDTFDFESVNDQLKQLVPGTIRADEVRRGQTDDQTARSRVIEAINRGQRLINYVGHGSVEVWQGNLLTSSDARQLDNDAPTIFVAMNCLNGFFQDLFTESLAEALMRADSGAVAVWASSALTEPAGQADVNREFFRLIFGGQRPMTLGEAAAQAKAATADTDIRRTWARFGDPTMRLR